MKQILAIHTEGRTRINPLLCPHEHTVFIQTGHQYTLNGEATDDCESYCQCCDCGWVLRDDRSWGALLEREMEIPYQ